MEGTGDEHAVAILHSVSCNIDEVSEVFTLTNKNLPLAFWESTGQRLFVVQNSGPVELLE